MADLVSVMVHLSDVLGRSSSPEGVQFDLIELGVDGSAVICSVEGSTKRYWKLQVSPVDQE